MPAGISNFPAANLILTENHNILLQQQKQRRALVNSSSVLINRAAFLQDGSVMERQSVLMEVMKLTVVGYTSLFFFNENGIYYMIMPW